MNVATTLARIVARLPVYGEIVTITRSGLAGQTPTTFTLTCLPQPISADQVTRLVAEGALNAAAAMPHTFVFDGQATVQEKDKITYNGWFYEVQQVTPTHLQGQIALWQAVATRLGKAS